MDMHGMIQNGMFGSSAPNMNQGFNPYQNNMIQFGNYYPPNYQFMQTGYIQQPQPNQYVFSPVPNNQTNYYNPYGNTFNQQPQFNGMNPYGNGMNPYQGMGYNGYRPFVSPMMQAQIQNQNIQLFKIKFRLANTYLGNEINEEKLDVMCNPNNPANQRSQEQIQADEDFRFIQYAHRVSVGEIPQCPTHADRVAYQLNLMSYNTHKEFDNHSLCEFLNDDLWKLQREQWIRENIRPNGNRDLSAVYNSNDYNELLKLHNSSSNQYMNQILDNSRYDNNLDDMELGMQMAFDRERRRKQILEGRVPEFISSDETQKRRHDWTQKLMDQIYRKGAAINV